MNKDLLEEYQNDECEKRCKDCVKFWQPECYDNIVCDDFERWVKDEN